MNWIQCKDQLPNFNTCLIVARKALYIRPGVENRCTFFTMALIHPHKEIVELDKTLYLWCKAALHSPFVHSFNFSQYLQQKADNLLTEDQRQYHKMSPLDWWLEIADPEPKVDFDIA